MEIIEIRDILDESGKTVFPRTHVDAVIGLKDTNFFEAVTDAVTGTTSIKLKSQYSGLWADGFVSAGGIGTGGGGGGGGLITSVRSVSDLGTPIATESLTETFSAKAIESIWESLSDFGASLSLSQGVSYFKDSNGNYFLDANGNRIIVGSGESSLNLLDKSGRVLSSVELDLDMSDYASIDWVQQNFLTQETDPTVPSWAKSENPPSYSFSDLVDHPTTLDGYGIIDAARASDFDALELRVDSIEDWFEVVTVNGEQALHAKSGRAIYSDSWVSAGGIGEDEGISISPATASILGGVLVGSVISTPIINAISSTAGRYYYLQTDSAGRAFVNVPWEGSGTGGAESDPIFTSSPAYGITTADITNWNSKTSNVGTITGITMNGASKGTSGVVDLGTVLVSHQGVTLESGTNNGTLKLTTAAGTVDNIAVKGLGSLAFKSSLEASDIPSLSGSYVTISGAQTVTGAKTFSATIAANGGVSINAGSVLEQNGGSTLVNYGARGTTSLNLYGTTVNLMSRNSSGSAANLLAVQNSAIVVDSKITPNDKAGLDLGGDSATKRWANIYGVNADLSGDVSLASASHIDIGPLRIEYDATNKALHITKKDGNDTESYGIYADGFVASGGIGQTS